MAAATSLSIWSRLRLGSSGWSVINTLAGMLPSFAGFVIVTNKLGASQLGLLALVTAALFPLRFSDLGVSGAVTRYVGAYRGPRPLAYVRQVLALSWLVSLAAFVVLLTVCMIVSPPLLRRTIEAGMQGAAWNLVPLLVLATIAQLFAGPTLGSLLGLQRFRLVYLTGTILSLLQLAAIAPLVGWFGIGGMVLAQMGVQIVTAVVLLSALYLGERDEMFVDEPAERLNRKAFTRFTLQFSGTSLLSSLVDPATKLTMGAAAPLAVVGAFEVIYRILFQLRSLLVAPFYPMGVRLIRQWQEGREVVKAPFARMTVLALAAATLILAAAPCVLAAYHLITVNTPPLAETWQVAAAVAVALFFGFLAVPGYFLCMAANDLRPIMASTVTNIAVILIAGPAAAALLGWPGVLCAFVLAYFVAALMQTGLASRSLHFGLVPRLADLWAEGRQLVQALRKPVQTNAVADGAHD